MDARERSTMSRPIVEKLAFVAATFLMDAMKTAGSAPHAVAEGDGGMGDTGDVIADLLEEKVEVLPT